MKCSGCYTEVKEGYCLSCRKKLFGKGRVPAVLPFEAPQAANLANYQEHSKRLSISGVQLKYSLCLEGNELKICDKNGQYILKPVPPSRQLLHTGSLPENEHLTMQIAEQVFGIGTAPNALIHFKDDQPAYLVRRFDVKGDGAKYMQEDFAQLTGRSIYTHGETFKYDGSYEEIGVLIKRFVPAAAPAIEKFFQLVLFNYIFSNGDAHLKNFSLIRNDNGQYQLAPAYDLLCTVIHTPHEADTAMDLYAGDLQSAFYSKHGFYGREHFLELARRLGMVEKRALRIMEQFSLQKMHARDLVRMSFLPAVLKEQYIAAMEEKLKRIQDL